MRPNKKAFTLVEMLVALAVSAVIVSATYASFELIKNQYKKNIDVTQLHTSGRAIMQVLEREIRMAGYEFRDDKGLMTYGKIIGPLALTDSGNKCCDEVTIIYDEVTDTLNGQGVVTSSIVDRIKTRFWTEAYSSTKRGSRFRLYKRRTVLGTNNAVLATPRVGAKEVMADYIEDLQIVNIVESGSIYSGFEGASGVTSVDPVEKKFIINWGSDRISALAFGADGSLYSAQDNNNFVLIHDVKTKKVTDSIDIGVRTSALAVDLNGLIYSGVEGVNSGVTVIDPVTKSVTKNFGSGQISALAFGPNGRLYTAHEGSDIIQIYNPDTGTSSGSININDRTSALAISSNGLIYSGYEQNNSGIRIIDPVSGNVVGNISAGQISALTFGANGLLYSAHDFNKYISIYNVATKKNIGAINATKRISALTTKIKKTGTESLVSINLTLRSKEKYGKNKNFLKKDYLSGNFNFSKNDPYQRDTFSTTVSVRNL
jgi:prepilin-type N-terminal cleavage/methylation domain-containing protein